MRIEESQEIAKKKMEEFNKGKKKNKVMIDGKEYDPEELTKDAIGEPEFDETIYEIMPSVEEPPGVEEPSKKKNKVMIDGQEYDLDKLVEGAIGKPDFGTGNGEAAPTKTEPIEEEPKEKQPKEKQPVKKKFLSTGLDMLVGTIKGIVGIQSGENEQRKESNFKKESAKMISKVVKKVANFFGYDENSEVFKVIKWSIFLLLISIVYYVVRPIFVLIGDIFGLVSNTIIVGFEGGIALVGFLIKPIVAVIGIYIILKISGMFLENTGMFLDTLSNLFGNKISELNKKTTKSKTTSKKAATNKTTNKAATNKVKVKVEEPAKRSNIKVQIIDPKEQRVVNNQQKYHKKEQITEIQTEYQQEEQVMQQEHQQEEQVMQQEHQQEEQVMQQEHQQE